MPESFNFMAVKDTTAGLAFIATLKDVAPAFFDSVTPADIKVELRVNGYEADFGKFVEMMVDHYQASVDKTAEEKILSLIEPVGRLVEVARDLEEAIRERTLNLVRDKKIDGKLNPE